MRGRKWAIGLVIGILLLAAALYWVGTTPLANSASAERFIRGALLAQYSRPVRADAVEKLAQVYRSPNAEVVHELTRMLDELRADQKAMEDRGATYRDSKVRIRFRSLQANGNEITAVVEVLADWHWGYDGLPVESPTQVYNLHEFRLALRDDRWQVMLHRNLASSPVTQVKVTSQAWRD